MRTDAQYQDVSFVEMAKLVGEHWQALSSKEKEPFHTQALSAKDLYVVEMKAYKNTKSYEIYAKYLAEFYEKHPRRR